MQRPILCRPSKRVHPVGEGAETVVRLKPCRDGRRRVNGVERFQAAKEVTLAGPRSFQGRNEPLLLWWLTFKQERASPSMRKVNGSCLVICPRIEPNQGGKSNDFLHDLHAFPHLHVKQHGSCFFHFCMAFPPYSRSKAPEKRRVKALPKNIATYLQY